MQRTFSVTVDRDSSTRWLVASVEQLPGCLTQAPDFPTLDANIHEAMDAWLDVFHEGRNRPAYRIEWQLDPKRLAGVLFASTDPYSYTVDRPVSPNARIQTLVFVKLRRNTYWGLQRIAWNVGFHWVHSVGSHHVFRSPDGRQLVMPRSHTDWIAAPLLRRILTTLGVSAEVYERLSRPVFYRTMGLTVPGPGTSTRAVPVRSDTPQTTPSTDTPAKASADPAPTAEAEGDVNPELATASGSTDSESGTEDAH